MQTARRRFGKRQEVENAQVENAGAHMDARCTGDRDHSPWGRARGHVPLVTWGTSFRQFLGARAGPAATRGDATRRATGGSGRLVRLSLWLGIHAWSALLW